MGLGCVFPCRRPLEQLEFRVARRCAKDDPAVAADYVSILDPGLIRDMAAQEIIRQWAARDSRAALEWAACYPARGLRADLVSTAAVAWNRRDEAGFQRWVQLGPTDPVRKAAAKLYATLNRKCSSAATWRVDTVAVAGSAIAR